jgi:hypothetical protein
MSQYADLPEEERALIVVWLRRWHEEADQLLEHPGNAASAPGIGNFREFLKLTNIITDLMIHHIEQGVHLALADGGVRPRARP